MTFLATQSFLFGRHELPLLHDEWKEQRAIKRDPIIAFSESPLEATFEGNWPAILSRSNVATPAAGTGYKRTPVTSRGHRVSWVSAPAQTMGKIVRRHDPSCADRPDAPFEHTTSPVDVRAAALVDWLTRAAAADRIELDPMLFDEVAFTVIDLIATRSAEVSSRRCRKRGATPRKQREITNAICTTIATRYDEKLSIADLASATGISPAYLSRIFRLQTGQSIHQYLVCTRLLSALAMLPCSSSLAIVAAHCGFSSHAHLTSTCTALLGLPPSQLDRKDAIRNLLQIMYADRQRCEKLRRP